MPQHKLYLPIKEVIKLSKTMSMRGIAKRYGCSFTPIARLYQEYNLKPKRVPRVPEKHKRMMKKIYESYKEGKILDCGKISDILEKKTGYKYAKTTISKNLSKIGVLLPLSKQKKLFYASKRGQKWKKDYVRKRDFQNPEYRKKLSRSHKKLLKESKKEQQHFKKFREASKNVRKPHIKTKNSELVRSKSEKLIADFLFDKKIRYIYERKLNLSGRIIYPDFCLGHSKKYIEYFGEFQGRGKRKFSKEDRKAKDKNKMKLYLKHKKRVLYLCPKDIRNGSYKEKILKFNKNF